MAEKQIILVTKDDLFIDVVSVMLEGWFDAKIEIFDSSRKIEAAFEQGVPRNVQLVLVEDEKLLATAGRAVGDFMAPAIVVGKAGAAATGTGLRWVYLDRPVNLDRLHETVRKLAEPAGPAAPPKEYCRIRLSTLALFHGELSHDTYKLCVSGQYEVAYRKGQKVLLSDPLFGELGATGFLYIKTADFAGFMKGFAGDIQSIQSRPDHPFRLGDAVELTVNVHDMVSQALPELGFTPELQAAVKATIDQTVTALQQQPKLADLLRELEKMQGSYLNWHSTALCYVSCRLSSLMTWDSPSTHFKLSLASFVHDLTLTNPKLQRLNTLEDVNAARLTPEEREAFLAHPFECAALVRSMSGFPGDVDHIVAEHHELPAGNGFPLGLNHARISPLASVFIVAHEIVDEMYAKRADFHLRDSVARLERAYPQGYFRRVIASLKDLAGKEGLAL